MKKFAQATAGLVLAYVAALSACTGALDELQESLKLPAVSEETKAVFSAAISDVTLQVVTEAVAVAREITSAVEAPPAAFLRLADAGQTIAVNQTVTPDGGGKIVITGTVTGTGTQAKGSVTVDFQAVWTDLPVKGSSEKTSGSQTLKGSMGWDSAAGEDKGFTLDVDVVGGFELNGESFAFDVVVTMDGSKFAFTGSVNGQSVSGNHSVTPPTRPVEVAPVAACVYVGEDSRCEPAPEGSGGEPTCTSLAYEFCVEYTDIRWTEAQITSSCDFAKEHRTNCPKAGLLGRCKMLEKGLAVSHYSYSSLAMTQQRCIAQGGSWEGYNQK